jgi:arsenite methyltransferase
MDQYTQKELVRARYGGIAEAASSASCCAPAASCCGPTADPVSKPREMGYSDAELAAVPEEANLGLGCGNPQAIASLKAGETMIDLGSGAGFDCFLASGQVGETGWVIGVDMTHEMLNKARENATKIGARNVEFRLGELEHLPVADNTADAILSNCVINLVPDKAHLSRGLPHPETGRTLGDLRCRQQGTVAREAEGRSRSAVRLHCRRCDDRGDGGLACGSRLRRCAGDAEG